MHRLGFLGMAQNVMYVRSVSPSRREMICLGQRLPIGTTAGDGGGEADAVRKEWAVHTWSQAWSRG